MAATTISATTSEDGEPNRKENHSAMLLVIIKCTTDYIEVTYPQIRRANDMLDDPSSLTFAADLNGSIVSRLRIMHKSLPTNPPASRTTVSHSQVVIDDEDKWRDASREVRAGGIASQLSASNLRA
jgi:hypothetical protein